MTKLEEAQLEIASLKALVDDKLPGMLRQAWRRMYGAGTHIMRQGDDGGWHDYFDIADVRVRIEAIEAYLAADQPPVVRHGVVEQKRRQKAGRVARP